MLRIVLALSLVLTSATASAQGRVGDQPARHGAAMTTTPEFVLGVVSVSTGGASLVVGALSLVLGALTQSPICVSSCGEPGDPTPYFITSAVTLPVGLLALLGGIALLASNPRQRVVMTPPRTELTLLDGGARLQVTWAF